jgi:broad specificity phosphatase PhoE
MFRTILLSILLTQTCLAETTTFLLIRHGETDWNLQKRFQGHADVPLNERGIEQARVCAEKINRLHGDITAIYSSDLSRARSTALETAKVCQMPVICNPSFREVRWGIVEGMDDEEVEKAYGTEKREFKRNYPHWQDQWNHTFLPGAETYEEVHRRVKVALYELAKLHPGEKVAVFMHGLAICLGIYDGKTRPDQIYINHCEIVQFTIDPITGEESATFCER